MSKTNPGIGKPERSPVADTDPGPPPSITDANEARRAAVNDLLETPLGRMPVRVVERPESAGMSAVQYRADAHHPPRPRLDHATIPNAKVLLNVTQPTIATAAPPAEHPAESSTELEQRSPVGPEPKPPQSLPTAPRIERMDTGRIPMRSRVWLVGSIGFAIAVGLAVLFKLTRGPASSELTLPSTTTTIGSAIVPPPVVTLAATASSVTAAPSASAAATSSAASTAALPTSTAVPSAPRSARPLASARATEPTHVSPPATASSSPPAPSAVPSSAPQPVPSNVPSGAFKVNQ